MILDQIEHAFMTIGDKVIKVSGMQSKFDEYEQTSELVVKPRNKEPKLDTENRNSLNNRTKQAINDLCVERYGVEIDLRVEKKHMITQFLEIQKQDLKGD